MVLFGSRVNGWFVQLVFEEHRIFATGSCQFDGSHLLDYMINLLLKAGRLPFPLGSRTIRHLWSCTSKSTKAHSLAIDIYATFSGSNLAYVTV